MRFAWEDSCPYLGLTGQDAPAGARCISLPPPESLRHAHQVGERLRVHLPHHAATVGFDRDLAGAESRCHLLVQQATHDQGHHFALAEGVSVS